MDQLDRKTFFVALLLAVGIILAGTYFLTQSKVLKDKEVHAIQEVLSSPYITDVRTDEEAVRALESGIENKVVLVHAPWCGHCRTMMKSFEDAAKSEPSVKWFRIDANVSPTISRRPDLKGFPTIYGLTKSGETKTWTGPRDILSLITFALSLKTKDVEQVAEVKNDVVVEELME